MRALTQEEEDYLAGWRRVVYEISLGWRPKGAITCLRLTPDYKTEPHGIGSRAWFNGVADAWCESIS